MPIYVKQYGCKRSGTCYLTALLQQNFAVRVLIHKLGGKHADPIDYHTWTKPPDLRRAIERGEVRVAVALKNPYAWVQSYIRAHIRWNPRFRQDYQHRATAAVRTLCHTWNRRNQAWLAVPMQFVMGIRHEDLLEDFQGAMARVAQQLQLAPRSTPFRNIVNKMTPNDTVSRVKFQPGYYLQHRYLQDLPDSVRRVIDKEINWEFAARLDYHPMEAS